MAGLNMALWFLWSEPSKPCSSLFVNYCEYESWSELGVDGIEVCDLIFRCGFYWSNVTGGESALCNGNRFRCPRQKRGIIVGKNLNR